MKIPYIESDCCVEHAGKHYCANGAVVTGEQIVAYPGAGGVLTDWHGQPIGTWRSVASWRVNSWQGSSMHQITAVVDGRQYIGRGMGEGMIFRGRRKA